MKMTQLNFKKGSCKKYVLMLSLYTMGIKMLALYSIFLCLTLNNVRKDGPYRCHASFVRICPYVFDEDFFFFFTPPNLINFILYSSINMHIFLSGRTTKARLTPPPLDLGGSKFIWLFSSIFPLMKKVLLVQGVLSVSATKKSLMFCVSSLNKLLKIISRISRFHPPYKTSPYWHCRMMLKKIICNSSRFIEKYSEKFSRNIPPHPQIMISIIIYYPVKYFYTKKYVFYLFNWYIHKFSFKCGF